MIQKWVKERIKGQRFMSTIWDATAEDTASSVRRPFDRPQHMPRPPLIRDVTAFLACLKRLKRHNDTVVFTNPHRLRILLRNDPTIDDDHLGFDVSLLTDDNEGVFRAVRNEVDVYEDEGCVVLDEFCFKETDTEDISKAVDFVNALNDWAMCPCGHYLIKDGNPHMCYHCELTRSADDLIGVFCPICHEEGFPRWMQQVPCCKQRLHRACRDACAAVALRCPLCRADWDDDEN